MKQEQVVVVVTGVGGLLGQSVVKALRLDPLGYAIHGCDCSGGHVGEAFVQGYERLPAASEGLGYVQALDAMAGRLGAGAVIPTSMAEIDLLAALGERPCLPSGIPVICQPWSWMSCYDDKLRCMQALSSHVALAPFADGLDLAAVDRLVSQAGFPLVVKARRCGGSRSVAVVHDGPALLEALGRTYEPLVQAFLPGEDAEYSVGLFGAEGLYEAIVLRRQLGLGGCSWQAEVVEAPEVADYALQVARASQLVGSANVQVRHTPQGVRLLEVNARFSSLVAARAAAGFADASWSVRLAMGMDLGPMGGPYKRLRFARFFHEMIDLGEGFESLAAWAPRTR